MEKVDQSGPIKDWFNKTFGSLGKRTRHQGGGLFGGKFKRKNKNVIPFEEASKMYESSNRQISVSDAQAISHFGNQKDNVSYGEQIYDIQTGNKPTEKIDTPVAVVTKGKNKRSKKKDD